MISTFGNALLDSWRKSLPVRGDALRYLDLPRNTVIGESGAPIEHVYFPVSSLVSVIACAPGSTPIEVSIIGSEGFLGLPLLFDETVHTTRLSVQRSGSLWQMESVLLQDLLESDPPYRRLLSNYAHRSLSHIIQNAMCAKTHEVKARLARRLLILLDRNESNTFASTHECCASKLGVRRASVTNVAISMQSQNVIRYLHGKVTILDRQALEALACPCHVQTQRAESHDDDPVADVEQWRTISIS